MCFDQEHLKLNVIFDRKMSRPTQKLMKMQIGRQALSGTKLMHEMYIILCEVDQINLGNIYFDVIKVQVGRKIIDQK